VTCCGPLDHRLASSRCPNVPPLDEVAVITPISYSGISAGRMPASASDSSVAAIEWWVQRSVCTVSLLGRWSPASKPRTSPATRAGYGDGSNSVIGPMPLCPASVAAQ
jgi:hypothetical protein